MYFSPAIAAILINRVRTLAGKECHFSRRPQSTAETDFADRIPEGRDEVRWKRSKSSIEQSGSMRVSRGETGQRFSVSQTTGISRDRGGGEGGGGVDIMH